MKHLDLILDEHHYEDYIFCKGLFARQFPIKQVPYKKRFAFYELSDDVVEVSDNFTRTVWNTGIMRHGRYFTIDTEAIKENPITLGKIVQNEGDIPEEFYVTNKEKLEKYEYLRGPKKIDRITPDGHK